MSVDIISATPLWVPLAAGGAAASAATGPGYGGYRLYKLKKKISNTAVDKETRFTEKEAKIIENVINRLNKKQSDDD
jgi:hypothetical protein